MKTQKEKEPVSDIMALYSIDQESAWKVFYLRSRYRWTIDLEQELVRKLKRGARPNVCEFGVTPETQQALLSEVMRRIEEDLNSQLDGDLND